MGIILKDGAYCINEVAYEEWREYRQKEKKVKIGDRAEMLQKKFLSRYPLGVQQQIIDQSIMSSYQGLFALKGGDDEKSGRFGTKQSHADSIRRATFNPSF